MSDLGQKWGIIGISGGTWANQDGTQSNDKAMVFHRDQSICEATFDIEKLVIIVLHVIEWVFVTCVVAHFTRSLRIIWYTWWVSLPPSLLESTWYLSYIDSAINIALKNLSTRQVMAMCLSIKSAALGPICHDPGTCVKMKLIPPWMFVKHVFEDILNLARWPLALENETYGGKWPIFHPHQVARYHTSSIADEESHDVDLMQANINIVGDPGIL